MVSNFKINFIYVDGEKIDFHEFEQKLFKKEFTGNEIIFSKILTNGEKKLLKEMKLWGIINELLDKANHLDEFSEKLRKAIENILEF